ncbi:unnamed protein product [Lathyrus sativus]|nr:unnamed protein product [Lathyrus sativus]
MHVISFSSLGGFFIRIALIFSVIFFMHSSPVNADMEIEIMRKLGLIERQREFAPPPPELADAPQPGFVL